MREINISNLRQWLNEDKITDPKRMVTNEDLKHWLDFDFTEPIIKEKIKAYNKGYIGGLNLRKDYNNIKPKILEKEYEKGRQNERKAWINGERCDNCGGLKEKSLSSWCLSCLEE